MDLFERSSILVHGIPKLYASKKYVDCKFLVGPDKVPFEAHKLILALASEAFEEQLYSGNTSDEPILVPDVDPDVFEAILRYIYLNEHPYTMRFSKDVGGIDQHNLIKLWYITSKYEVDDLKRKYLDEIKINITNWFVVYNASKMLLNGPLAAEEQMKLGSGSLPNIIRRIRQDERKNVEGIVIRCQKVFSVKTPAALGDSFIKRMPEHFLKDLFAVEYMSIENELALFQFLVRYAHENGWKPNDEYFLDKDENGTELATPFQKYIREAMKQIRFLSMTLKMFDSIPSKSGFFTEFEVKTIRDRIADDSCQCVSVAGFSTVTNKKRHELLNVTFLDTQQEQDQDNQGDKDIEKLAFNVELPKDTLGLTESFTFNNLTWRIIIYNYTDKRLGYLNRYYSINQYTVYLKCEGLTASDRWKCYAQLDIVIESKNENDGRKVFENIPWHCFMGSTTSRESTLQYFRDKQCLIAQSNYSQSQPFECDPAVKACRMELTVSPHEVPYKNKDSNVTATYRTVARNYE